MSASTVALVAVAMWTSGAATLWASSAPDPAPRTVIVERTMVQVLQDEVTAEIVAIPDFARCPMDVARALIEVVHPEVDDELAATPPTPRSESATEEVGAEHHPSPPADTPSTHHPDLPTSGSWTGTRNATPLLLQLHFAPGGHLDATHQTNTEAAQMSGVWTPAQAGIKIHLRDPSTSGEEHFSGTLVDREHLRGRWHDAGGSVEHLTLRPHPNPPGVDEPRRPAVAAHSASWSSISSSPPSGVADGPVVGSGAGTTRR